MKTITMLSVIVCYCLYAAVTHATLTNFNSRTAFNSNGNITYNYGFEDFTGSSYYEVGGPWPSHGVTYTTDDNIIIGPTRGSGNSTNVLIYNHWTPLTAAIDPGFDMFALDLGVLGVDSLLNFYLDTNIATYSLTNLSVSGVGVGLDFYGFVAGSGEFFTGFRLESVSGVGSAAAIDNVTLGNSTPQPPTVPEPSTLLLLGVGLLGMGMMKKRIRS